MTYLKIVLRVLVSNTMYVNTTIAFVREWTVINTINDNDSDAKQKPG